MNPKDSTEVPMRSDREKLVLAVENIREAYRAGHKDYHNVNDWEDGQWSRVNEAFDEALKAIGPLDAEPAGDSSSNIPGVNTNQLIQDSAPVSVKGEPREWELVSAQGLTLTSQGPLIPYGERALVREILPQTTDVVEFPQAEFEVYLSMNVRPGYSATTMQTAKHWFKRGLEAAKGKQDGK